MKYATLHKIAGAIGAGRYARAASIIDAALLTESGPAWQRSLSQLADFLRDPARVPFSAVLGRGNGKLPFLTFSALPGVTCPGAGECLDWCYSFKAWRYPAAFARQAQNTALLTSAAGRAHILAALDGAGTAPVDFRLYVDGDFASVAIAEFWAGALAARPNLNSYGYSKSIRIILAASALHNLANYRLNLSSGSNATAADLAAVERLPITRGRFIAVDMGRKVSSADHGDRAHQAELRQAYGATAFTCPGACGDCTPHGHACGAERFRGVDIIIATH